MMKKLTYVTVFIITLLSFLIDIMEIPDLDDDVEEDEEDDIKIQIANAPKFSDNTLPTLQQLNNDIKYAIPTAIVRDVALSDCFHLPFSFLVGRD